mgnify:FL=1
MKIKKSIMKSIIAAVFALGLGGCADTQSRMQSMSWLEIGGTLGGAVMGGYVGSQLGGGFGQTLFMTAGVLMGGSSGYTATRNLGYSDQSQYDSTVRQALAQAEDGEVVHWQNPETGLTGIFRAVNTHQHSNGQYCREYRASVAFDDGIFSGGGVACQMVDGTWAKFHDEFS